MLLVEVALQILLRAAAVLPVAAFERTEDAGPQAARVCIFGRGVWWQGRALAEVPLCEVLVSGRVVTTAGEENMTKLSFSVLDEVFDLAMRVLCICSWQHPCVADFCEDVVLQLW